MFQKAIQKNENSWVNQYYNAYLMMEDNSNQILSHEAVDQIEMALRKVCNLMIVDMTLETIILREEKGNRYKQE